MLRQVRKIGDLFLISAYPQFTPNHLARAQMLMKLPRRPPIKPTFICWWRKLGDAATTRELGPELTLGSILPNQSGSVLGLRHTKHPDDIKDMASPLL